MTQTERFDMAIPTWLKEAVKVIAERKGISVSEYVKDLLKEAVTKDSKMNLTGE